MPIQLATVSTVNTAGDNANSTCNNEDKLFPKTYFRSSISAASMLKGVLAQENKILTEALNIHIQNPSGRKR